MIAKDAKFLHADNEDSDQTARMRKLIRVFVERISSEGTFSFVTVLFSLHFKIISLLKGSSLFFHTIL